MFSLTWPGSMQIYWNKRKHLHKKRVQLPEDWFGTPTWPPFHCFFFAGTGDKDKDIRGSSSNDADDYDVKGNGRSSYRFRLVKQQLYSFFTFLCRHHTTAM